MIFRVVAFFSLEVITRFSFREKREIEINGATIFWNKDLNSKQNIRNEIKKKNNNNKTNKQIKSSNINLHAPSYTGRNDKQLKL
jgi:hypothetical protein